MFFSNILLSVTSSCVPAILLGLRGFFLLNHYRNTSEALMSSHFTKLNSLCELQLTGTVQAEHVFQRVWLAVLSERRTINRLKALASLTISIHPFIQPAIFCLLSGPKLVQTSVPGSLPSSWTNASLKKHPDQIPKPPHQASFQIYRTEVLTLSLRLSPETRQSKLAVVGESRNVDRCKSMALPS